MKRKLWKTSMSVVLVIGAASAASAHPGHGQGGGSFSVAHYLTEPTHVFGVLIPLVGIVAACWLLKRGGRFRAI